MKKKSIELMKRYRFFAIMIVVTLAILVVKPDMGVRVYSLAFNSVLECWAFCRQYLF